MGYSCNIIALSDYVPRVNILKEQPASAQETQAQLDQLWPGRFRYVEDDIIGCGLDGDPHAVAFGSTLLMSIGLVYDEMDDPALLADPRDIWVLNIESTTGYCFYRTPTREFESPFEESGFDLKDQFAGKSLLDFEVPFVKGEHKVILEPDEVRYWESQLGKPAPRDSDGDVSFLFNPLDLGNAASKWIFGIEGEPATPDSVMDSLPDRSHVTRLPMYRFEEPA